jgi:putative flippase GtrA
LSARSALRYAAVGGIAFAVDLGCLLALVEHMPLLAANTLAFLAANAVNFWLGHVWVFERSFGGPAMARQYAGVLVISVVGLGLNDALVWGGVEIAGAPLVASKIIATGVVMFWNYMARALWVYREG